jgi:hypothetical protein
VTVLSWLCADAIVIIVAVAVGYAFNVNIGLMFAAGMAYRSLTSWFGWRGDLTVIRS